MNLIGHKCLFSGLQMILEPFLALIQQENSQCILQVVVTEGIDGFLKELENFSKEVKP